MTQALIINLKRNPERRKHALNECARCGLRAEILEATDARNLSQQWISKNATEDLISKLEDEDYRWMNPAALATTDSHRRCFEKAVETTSQDITLVLEDDFFWLDSPRTVSRILNAIGKSRFKVVLLGYSVRTPFTPDFSAELELTNGYVVLPFEQPARTAGAYAYTVTPDAAKKLLDSQAEGIDREADDFAREHGRLGKAVEMGIIYPPIAHHNLFDSEIWMDQASNGFSARIRSFINSVACRSVVAKRIYGAALKMRLKRRYVS